MSDGLARFWFSFRCRSRDGVWWFALVGVNRATFVKVVSFDSRVFNSLHGRRLTWLFVVFNPRPHQPYKAEVSTQGTHCSAILRFSPPRIALLKWVKNSVLKTQLISGSGTWGELTPRENQSSFSVEVPTNLMAPNGIFLSEEMESWRFIIADTTI